MLTREQPLLSGNSVPVAPQKPHRCVAFEEFGRKKQRDQQCRAAFCLTWAWQGQGWLPVQQSQIAPEEVPHSLVASCARLRKRTALYLGSSTWHAIALEYCSAAAPVLGEGDTAHPRHVRVHSSINTSSTSSSTTVQSGRVCFQHANLSSGDLHIVHVIAFLEAARLPRASQPPPCSLLCDRSVISACSRRIFSFCSRSLQLGPGQVTTFSHGSRLNTPCCAENAGKPRRSNQGGASAQTYSSFMAPRASIFSVLGGAALGRFAAPLLGPSRCRYQSCKPRKAPLHQQQGKKYFIGCCLMGQAAPSLELSCPLSGAVQLGDNASVPC